jgi:Na+-driven multidrug efflux pump
LSRSRSAARWVLGLFGLPKFGMGGVAAGQLTAFTLGAIFLAWYLRQRQQPADTELQGF